MTSCWHCKEIETPQKSFQRCGSCNRAVYCCREHQKEDWRNHCRVCQAFKLSPAPDKPFLICLTNRKIPKDYGAPTGEYLFHKGLLNLEPESGYIEDVKIYHESGVYVGKARIHRDALSWTCGKDSVEMLEQVKRLSGSAFLFSGGDISKGQIGIGLHSLLHKITIDPDLHRSASQC